MKRIVTGLLLAMLFIACKKGDVNTAVDNGNVPPPTTPLKTAAGVPQGAAATKKIGTAGGSIESPDGKIHIDIPAGALASDQTISIQPVTNTLDFAATPAYRVLPQGLTFEKPATVTFTYSEADIKSTLPEGLGAAAQKADGSWAVLPKKQLNKAEKKVSVSFAKAVDLTFFPLCYIKPYDARVKTGEKLHLAVMATMPDGMEKYPQADGSYITGPYQVMAELVGEWSYDGKGHLTPGGATAEYTAPSQVPSRNPEAVSVKLKLHMPGVFQLVANITVLGEHRIDYLQVDETEMDADYAKYPSRLYIHGNFGNDSGAGKRSVKINGNDLNIVFWAPNLIACDLVTSGPYSSGPVVVSCDAFTDTKLLNEWLITLEYMKVESPGASLTRRCNLNIHLRGDADGFFKEGQHSLFSYTDININSTGVVNMPAGTFSTHTEADGCVDYKVTWDKLEDVTVSRLRHNTYAPGVSGEVVHAADGFKIKLRFNSGEVLRCTRIERPCTSPAVTNIVMEPIMLAGYEDKEIHFQFSGVGPHSTILAGSMPELKQTGVASGLYFDRNDYNPDLYYTRMSWKAAEPKW